MADRYRPDKDGTHRGAFEKNKKRIYATQTVCGICGLPVDFSYKYPDPLSACIDHIIPISKGGHPSDIDNLQLAHMMCNRQFQSTLPRRERLLRNIIPVIVCKFQSTLPRRERPYARRSRRRNCRFQSTLPRRERPRTVFYRVVASDVSIHAPTKGATTSQRKGDKHVKSFNPRSHEGSDKSTP